MSSDKSFKDKSINDVTANVKREAREVKDAAADKVEYVEDRLEDAVSSVQNVSFSTNQKLLLATGLTLLASTAVTALFNKYRKPLEVVQNFETVIVEAGTDEPLVD